MKNLILILTNVLLCLNLASAQCAADELEIRVEINTDNWGFETSWVLKNITGDTLMSGGQDGAYNNYESYSDSLCVSIDECLIFEIYDSYGDGILAPNGYGLYVDEELVASGANDIQSYAMEMLNCNANNGLLMTALNDLQGHVDGSNPLSQSGFTQIKDIFTLLAYQLPENEDLLLLSKTVLEAYDAEFGAVFTTSSTQYGFSKATDASPQYELERAVLALQQGIFDYVFTPEVYAVYPDYIEGYFFESCSNFPGFIDPPADSEESHSVMIRANFADPDGTNPYFDINGDGTNHALRPTGLYLAPGSIAEITVPESLLEGDYYIRVGSHEWDLSNRPTFRRLDRISKKFPINSTTTEVFNPKGGAISILVPFGADAGIVEVSVVNGVQAPFFTMKSFTETPSFEEELEKPGHWAVFETDNVMYTIPKHSIVPGQYDLKQTLRDWDKAIQATNSIMGRAIIPDKHNMYMIADIIIRYGAYSIGYPMSNTPLNYTSVPGPAYFINGPGPDDEVNFHEHGHALKMSKFPGEVEALVNVPYIMGMHHGLGTDLDEAVRYSFVPNTFDIDKTATHRMVSNTFGEERNISNTTMDEVRYQHRGYGHYFEMVDMFGWCPLRNFWRQEYIDSINGNDHGINNQDIDSRILRLCIAAQQDLRPLFHVFGVLPQDASSLQGLLEENNIESSLEVYNRLQEYFDLIPQDNAAFVAYALSVYPNLYTSGPTAPPDYGVGWHYLRSLEYDSAEATERSNILQGIVDLYFPDGEPTGEAPDVCCTIDLMDISFDGVEVAITGGVAPFEISMDTLNNTVLTINVSDFDGCTQSAEYLISSAREESVNGISIYPNPASTVLYIEAHAEQHNMGYIKLFSADGRLARQFSPEQRTLDISDLAEGIYFIQIGLLDGKQFGERIVLMR